MAPEAAGQILVNVPQLIDEFAPLFLSKSQLEPFVAGIRWAAMQLALVNPDVVRPLIPDLFASLESQDVYERTYAAAALVRVGAADAQNSIRPLLDDETVITTYDLNTGDLVSMTAGSFVREILH
jgi:hypothetical protein